jgi:type I restriction enzyme S subunit
MAGETAVSGKYTAYLEYKDSGIEVIGNVPKDWVVGRLKQIVDQNRQITYGIVQAGPNKKDGIPYIRPADMAEEGGVKSYEDLLQTSPEIAADYERSKIKPGDIICSIGPSFGKLMITPERLDGANLTQGTARVAISSTYNTRYFFWALRSTSSFQQWESSVGGATFRALNLAPLADTFLVVPTGEEQQKIANFLDHETAKIDTLIEIQQQLVKLLKEKRQAVISHAVTKGLNPNAPMRDSGVEWLGEVPEGWEVTRAKFVSDIFVPQRNKPDLNDSDGLPWAIMEDMKNPYIENTKQFVSEEACKEAGSKMLKAGSVIASCVGNFGIASINKVDVIINQQLQAFVPSVIKAEYLREIVSISTVYFDLIGTAATLVYVNQQGFENLPVLLPPENEQNEICAFVDKECSKFDKLMAQCEITIDLLQERRTALISAAVTGKIDVRNWRAA